LAGKPRRKPRSSWAASRCTWRPIPARDVIDKYGRTLAYVWTASGRLFNLDMTADGYAHEYTCYVPYRYQADFKAA
jgi:endonuclease YncB( thermonuclease family)